MMKCKKTYRCTRMMPYSNKDCPGYNDPTCRQGHYFSANSEFAALAMMVKDNNLGECAYGYTIEEQGGQLNEEGHPCFFFWDIMGGMREYLKVRESEVLACIHKKYHDEFSDREEFARILDRMSIINNRLQWG